MRDWLPRNGDYGAGSKIEVFPTPSPCGEGDGFIFVDRPQPGPSPEPQPLARPGPQRKTAAGDILHQGFPTFRATLSRKLTAPFCRLPLPTLFYRLEAAHLGDLMRLLVRPDEVL